MPARIAVFIAGAWLLGSLFMGFVATENFATVDRVMQAPPPEAGRMIESLGPQDARLFLRYLAGEENRRYFQDWELVELGMAIGLAVIFLASATRGTLTALSIAALALTAVQHFALTPLVVARGIAIAFSTSPDRLANFGKLHAIYGVVELAKDALVLVIAGALIARDRATMPVAPTSELRASCS